MSENKRKKIHWGRWIGTALLLLLVGLLLFHTIWSGIAEGQVQQQITKLKQLGEPILPADFAVSDPEGSDNGGADIQAAATLINREGENWKAYGKIKPALPLSDAEREVLQKLVADSSDAMKRLDVGLSKSRLDWNLNFTSPVLDQAISANLSGPRSLANILSADTLLSHEKGDDRCAVQNIHRIILVSRYAEKYPSIIGHLVALGCVAVAADSAVQISPDLRIGAGAGDVSPEDMQRLINVFLDDRPSKDGIALALRGERMMQLDFVQSMLNGVPFRNPSGGSGTARKPSARYFLKPVLHRNAAIMLNYMTALIDSLDVRDMPSFAAKNPPRPSDSRLNIFISIMLPSMDRVVMTSFRGMTERRLTAIALAIRWFAHDHDGRIPQTLDELVPRYLPAVPKDPFIKDSAMKYLPRADDPVIYSVGEDGVDDGGSEAPSNPNRIEVMNWDMSDRVLHLKRQPRRAPEGEE